MKLWLSRILASSALAMIVVLLVAGAATTTSKILEPDKLIILSTTDVKGKTSPCG
jgi:hypothetical protein